MLSSTSFLYFKVAFYQTTWSVINYILIPDGENEPSEVHIGRMLQILREFSDDSVLSSYVIDDIWDDMKAMKVCSTNLINFILEKNYHVLLSVSHS